MDFEHAPISANDVMFVRAWLLRRGLPEQKEPRDTCLRVKEVLLISLTVIKWFSGVRIATQRSGDMEARVFPTLDIELSMAPSLVTRSWQADLELDAPAKSARIEEQRWKNHGAADTWKGGGLGKIEITRLE